MSSLLGTINIKYIDINTNSEITNSENYTNLKLGNYTYTAKSISDYSVAGYSVTDNSSATITLTDSKKDVTIIFMYKKTLGKVTIKYVLKSTGENIASPTVNSDLPLGSYTYYAVDIDKYTVIDTNFKTVTLTDSNYDMTIVFEYEKVITEIPDDLNINEVPYISTYYIKPIVKPAEEVFIDYYITDYYHKEYLEEDFSEVFTVTVRVEGQKDKIYHNLKPGDHTVSLGSFSTEGEQKFSILCTDKYGRNSHELFNFFLIMDDVEVKEYIMTEDDLVTYNIKNTDEYEVKNIVDLSSLESKNSTTIKAALLEYATNIIPKSKTYVCLIADTNGDGQPDTWWRENQVVYANDYDKDSVLKESTNTRIGLQQLLDDKKKDGYNKLTLLPGTYRIDHQKQIYIPTDFTLDMNGSTIKQNQFTGYQSLMIDINDCFNSHLINGTIEGDYYSHDYANSGGNSEGILGVSISSSSKYCSYDNILIKDITGYGAGNGIAYTRDNISHTYLSYKNIGNSFKLGDIDRSTGTSIASNSRTTSDFIDISGYESIGYLSISKYLGYQGNDCGTWNIICHFYDTNKNFIQSIDSYQYRRIRVPSKSRYIKITILNTVYPTNLTIQYFRVPTHCSFTNIEFENCRAVGLAQSAMNDMLVENCTFTRSGQALARCAYDAEDGWDMMQDCFLRNLKFINNSLNDIVIFAGHNFVFENNINGKLIIYERCNSYTVRNCNNLINAFIGNKSRVRTGYRRFYNNTVIRSVNIDGGTNWPMIAKDCRILNRADGSESNKYLRCTIGQDTFPTSKLYDYGLGRAQYIKCNIQNIYSLHNYMGNYYECKINNMRGEFQKGSTTTLFSNCELYNLKINILHDDNFIVTFNGCTIKESKFDELQQGIGVNISFINCNIDISTSLTKLRTCSLQKPMLFENNIITGSSADGLINFYQDYSPSWGIVQQDNVTLKNNNITLYSSPYVIIGLTKNTLNYVNIISISNKFTPNTLLLCNPEAKLSSNIKITEN